MLIGQKTAHSSVFLLTQNEPFVSQPFISGSLGGEKDPYLHLFINADMQFRQNNKRFNRTFYLYYTHFLANIYWHFIQNRDKIPKTHRFRGLNSIFPNHEKQAG